MTEEQLKAENEDLKRRIASLCAIIDDMTKRADSIRAQADSLKTVAASKANFLTSEDEDQT